MFHLPLATKLVVPPVRPTLAIVAKKDDDKPACSPVRVLNR